MERIDSERSAREQRLSKFGTSAANRSHNLFIYLFIFRSILKCIGIKRASDRERDDGFDGIISKQLAKITMTKYFRKCLVIAAIDAVWVEKSSVYKKKLNISNDDYEREKKSRQTNENALGKNHTKWHTLKQCVFQMSHIAD